MSTIKEPVPVQYPRLSANTAQDDPQCAAIDKALKASKTGEANSGVDPTYAPGEEPKRWLPKLDTPLSDISYLDPRLPRKNKGKGYHLMLSASSEYLGSGDCSESEIQLAEHAEGCRLASTSIDGKKAKAATAPTQPSAAKLRREAKSQYYRSIGTGPDLEKVRQVELKNTRVYNRLARCDISIYHPGRNCKRDVSSKIADGINIRIAVSRDNLKILAVLHAEDPLTGNTGFYNLASLNWHISSRSESFIHCYIDKMEERHLTKTGCWQFKPTYFFEVKNQGKLEYAHSGQTTSVPVSPYQVRKGQELITTTRNLIFQCLNEQKQGGVSDPVAWFAVHSLSPQTDGDDALAQISSQDSKFRFTSWNAVPMPLLQDKLSRTLRNLEQTVSGKPVSSISQAVTMKLYHKALLEAKAHGTVGIPLENEDFRSQLLSDVTSNTNEASSHHTSALPTRIPSSEDIASTYADGTTSDGDYSVGISGIDSTVSKSGVEGHLEASRSHAIPELSGSNLIALGVEQLPSEEEEIIVSNKNREQKLNPKSATVQRVGKSFDYTTTDRPEDVPPMSSESVTLGAGDRKSLSDFNIGAYLESAKLMATGTSSPLVRDTISKASDSKSSFGVHVKMDEIATNRLIEARQAKRREKNLEIIKSHRRSIASAVSMSPSTRSNASESGGVSVYWEEYENKLRQYMDKRKNRAGKTSRGVGPSEGGVGGFFDADINKAIELASISIDDEYILGSSDGNKAESTRSMLGDVDTMKKKFELGVERL
ncbi:hypothetical protein H072_7617 [Dactylellina haptotyla CBS 200.50]|uniref:Uncharacterized protein n=1 Tax=Dactylellina haptotyla (strain CBS 200.50) TaxID=1284197 RepID=S8BTM2_DACHA|nr:hypothetical protein H072_7617 [Dactylellina haptotyla CBS 200.50]